MKRPWGHICILTAAVMSIMLSGCGKAKNNLTSTLSVDEDGSLTQTIAEVPDEDMSEDELETYIEEQVSAYNKEKGTDGVSLDSCKVTSKQVKIVMKYDSCTDYTSFNQMECFLGTIAEAEAAGYNFDAVMKDKKDQEAEKSTISERKDEWKVLIVEEPMNVKVYDKVLYTTENAEITGRLTVAVNAEESEAASATEEVSEIVSSSSADAAPVAGGEDDTLQKQISEMTEQNAERAYIIFK